MGHLYGVHGSVTGSPARFRNCTLDPPPPPVAVVVVRPVSTPLCVRTLLRLPTGGDRRFRSEMGAGRWRVGDGRVVEVGWEGGRGGEVNGFGLDLCQHQKDS